MVVLPPTREDWHLLEELFCQIHAEGVTNSTVASDLLIVRGDLTAFTDDGRRYIELTPQGRARALLAIERYDEVHLRRN